MSGRNTSKKDMNFITKLPKSVISHILSSLPTKDAIRTSVLSKAWKYKWESIYNLSIQDWQRFSVLLRKKSSFVRIMPKILFHSRELKSVRLVCVQTYDSSQFTRWINAILMCEVERFELITIGQEGVVLPRDLLNKTSLRILKLVLSCTFRVPSDNYYQNLTSLHFEKVEILKFSNNNPLVFTFPVLETLVLRNCIWSNVSLVEIHSPALTKFKCMTVLGAQFSVFTIDICGARIEKFESSGGFPENITLRDSVVLSASFLNEPFKMDHESENDEDTSDLQRGLQVRKMLTKFSCVADLELLGSMSEAVALSKQELSLPRYDKLQRLVMCVLVDTKLLFELLDSAPNLKFLEIFGRHEEFDCDEVYHVPCCVISYLEEITFKNVGKESIIHLAKFFLNNAMKLKKVYISSNVLESAEIVNELLEFPRASACSTVVSA